ncbi:hypothetical protein [Novosphingobium resinovorum]|uniref:hypothetical protein n=1 Tax=Novosphingobium resinovorum TaxID=158500 RepID=UPI002ED030B3|nr:hypothetical protein [Novosphingobium resinovorum]
MHQPSDRPLDDRHWRRLNRFANVAFAGRRWGDADRLYGAALQEATRLFDLACVGIAMRCEAAPMLVVATTNAAENWLMLGRNEDAAAAVSALARRLSQVAEDEAGAPDFRRQCVIHLKGAVRSLTSVLPRAGWPNEAVVAEVMQARSVALRFVGGAFPRH